jgi:glycosyltransferase involved in cell wall biosynthesis
MTHRFPGDAINKVLHCFSAPLDNPANVFSILTGSTAPAALSQEHPCSPLSAFLRRVELHYARCSGIVMENTQRQGRLRIEKIAVIGNYLPRQCGIAAFTTDLCESLAARYGDTICFSIPVTDTGNFYKYPPRVRFELAEQDISSYRRVAEFLNMNDVDLVCLQHEYGIFGGPAGSHILALLRELRMPVVTTLHTILREPDPQKRAVMMGLKQISDRFVVMSNQARMFLQDVYGIKDSKVDIIPHGIPDVTFIDPNFYKDRFGAEGKFVLLTFGLISRGKGIEDVITAMPRILERYENVVYIILGATHPAVLRAEGETYRLTLQTLAQDLGVDGNVFLHNRFVPLEELVEFIGAADVYVTPYLNEGQIVSGTLAYAVGMGKAVVTTPYWYATELLADGRGRIVPFRDPDAIARSVLHLLDNEAERHAMRKNAYLFGRGMIWSKVAERYMETFERTRDEHLRRPDVSFEIQMQARHPDEQLRLNISHVRLLTDETGILQHAVYSVPNLNEGYTTDDNARALLLAVLLEATGYQGNEEISRLASRYLSFLWYAFNNANNRFRNILSYDRRWAEAAGSEDSHGRALWALGAVLGRSSSEEFRRVAGTLFELALPEVKNFTSLRAWAYTLIGIHEYLRKFEGDRLVYGLRKLLSKRMLALYRQVREPSWPWFENIVAYGNATISHAMLLCGRWIPREEMVTAGLESLRWLAEIQTGHKGYFSPIGSNGFYPKGGVKASFDQQPLEAYSMVAAALEAFRMTNDSFWQKEARRAFNWFLGRNDLEMALYDMTTGGCRDGLHQDRINRNQGAESTLSFLLALAEMRLSQNILEAEHELHKP